jgi:glycosyltransferase involved in cell wall biosynthesis
MKDLISVIIPVFNHARTLRRSIRSLVAQTYRPLEVVVVNDGSIDNFTETIEKIKSKIKTGADFIFKVISQENRGASAARNRGFKETIGDYIIFWDADTIGRPEMLERLKRQLDEHPENSYVYCQYKFGWKKMKSQPFSSADLKKYNYIDTTSLVRREALGVAPFDESLARFQDWDLWLTLLEQNKAGIFAPEVLYTKIVHGRKGYSSWLPSFVFRLPWKTMAVKNFELAKKVVLDKHHLL